MNWLTTSCLLLASSGFGTAYTILALTPHVGNSSQSHFWIMTRLSEVLVNRGHHVIMPIHEHMHSDSKLVEIIKVGSSMTGKEWEENSLSFMSETVYGNLTVKQIGKMIHNQARECEAFFEDNAVLEILKSRKIDVAIIDQFFNCGFLYASKLRLPVIGIECGSNFASIMDTIDPFPLAYAPVPITSLSQRMNFGERLTNALMYWIHRGLGPSMLYTPYRETQLNHGLHGEDIAKLKSDVFFWISNQGWVIDYPRPIMPNVVQAPGMLTKSPEPLDKEFQDIYDRAGQHGVIIVSFGSYISLKGLPIERILMDGLSNLSQQVIYRATHEVHPLPENVHRFSSLPQNNLLGHAGTKACVLHGGLNGIYEAIYNAVPMLIIPAAFDAPDNAVRVVDKGMGLHISPQAVVSRDIHGSITRLITENRFKKRVKRYSSIMKARQEHPLDKAAFWVEHVLQYGTEDYLTPAGKDLSFIALHMLDVICVCLAVSLTLISLIIFICIKCIKFMCRVRKLKSD